MPRVALRRLVPGMQRGFLARILVLLAIAAPMAGCLQLPGAPGHRRSLAPTMDRLVAAYDDLAGRRFQVVADFEDPVQASLFRLEPAGADDSIGISTDRAQLQTGVGSLRVSFSRPGERLACAAFPESQWGFPRDWSKYHLLLLSVYSPRQIGGLLISACSGSTVEYRYETPPLLLMPGWNLLRLDLGDMAEQIDLADLRSLEFRLVSLEEPIDLFLDDLILVDNARELFSTPERQPGDFYARTAGRRLVIGAVDRFELTFSKGRIRQWFDTGFDRSRIHNLVGPGAMGPMPAPTCDPQAPVSDIQDAGRRLGAGTTLETYQSLVSATPLRIVVQGEWRYTPPNTPPSDGDPYHRWLYTIYRDGRVYVECSGAAGPDNPQQMALAFCCDASGGFQTHMVAASEAADSSAVTAGRDHYLLFSRPDKGQADLLIVPFATPPASPSAFDTPDGCSCGCWSVKAENGRFHFGSLIRVWPPDIDSPEQAAAMAADYRHPLPLQIDAGQLVRTDPGDLDNDGFAEARGHYALQLDGSIAKVRIDGLRTLRFSPVFKLVDVVNRDVWAYLDGRQIRDAVRDEDGNVILILPGVISREVLLEITSRPRQPGAASAVQVE